MTETQTAALFDPPTEPRELIRHYTLSAGDLAIVHRCRGEHNRLGCALMLCYLRYPGCPLRAGERPPAELTAFVAEQIDAPPTAIEAYLAAERNRQRHAVECQERLRLRPFGKHAAAGLADVLHPHACENDRLFHLAELVMEECRRRRIVVPGPRRLERLCIDLRFRARREIERRLTDGLFPEAAPPVGRVDAAPSGDRRYYEFCVLSELCGRLRAGDVWVAGSRRYRSFEEHLISREVQEEMLQTGILPVAVDPDFERFIESRHALLDARLAAVDAKAKDGLLLDVSLEKGVLKIAPIEKSTPPDAEMLAARLYAMLPRIRVTDLLSEVAGWTLFTDCFTHLRSGEMVADPQILMAGLLADGLNLGLTRMAEACTIASLGQLAWVADWHIRDETYALALRRLVDHQQREPLAAVFGDGFASSSDGQFFRARGFGRDVGRLNAHYGDDPGSKFYTHVSDRFAPFFTKVIAATASEALHILDGLLYHQSDVAVRRHHTDGGGDSEHVFALLALLGFQFAPRIPDLKHRRLYSFAKPSTYPTLEPLIAGRLNVALIRAHWPEILRVAASIRTGSVTASLIMRQLAAYPRQNGVAAALRELGRLERTLFTLDWIEDPELRRATGRELNKGESRNSLARAVFIHRLGEIRDRTYENQQHRASGLNLLVAAITLWNTRYLNRAIAAMRETEDVPDHLLAHLSPLGWEHINLTGDYVWSAADEATENRDGLRSLRPASDPALLAA